MHSISPNLRAVTLHRRSESAELLHSISTTGNYGGCLRFAETFRLPSMLDFKFRARHNIR